MRRLATLSLVLFVAGVSAAEAADPARSSYQAALARERQVGANQDATLQQLRAVVSRYDTIVRRFPRSPYSDNALWQAAGVLLEAYARFGDDADRQAAIRRLERLEAEYPSSSLVSQIERRLTAAAAPSRPSDAVVGTSGSIERQASVVQATEASSSRTTTRRRLQRIERKTLPDVVRIVMEFDDEVDYYEERIGNPDRVFFDLRNVEAAPGLLDRTLTYQDDAVRTIRLGRHPDATTRVVLELDDVLSHSVFVLYDPYRLVIDCTRSTLPATRVADEAPLVPVVTPAIAAQPEFDGSAPSGIERAPDATPIPSPAPAPTPAAAPPSVPAPSAPAAPPSATSAPAPSAAAPAPPARNSSGRYSLARQLGLGISRIVIDPGHGGHDPGAKGPRLTEAELVLDIALRLEQLLLEQEGFEVVLTRRTDEYVPLEQRTAIANRAEADLFLSIHGNAHRDPKIGGIETYFLNFASNASAAAVAARENSVSGATMGKLPDIVKAIALNNKLDESRDLARAVQRTMLRELRTTHKGLRDLGVKQAPFVVLIGAGMPSVLAEVSFLTNREEARLLRTEAYRKRVASALCDAIVGYQRSLKKSTPVAEQ